MAECIVLKGGGADLDAVTAGAGDVLAGKVIVGSDGEPLTGTMPNNGAVSQSLGINGTYMIPAGYHNGSGKVTQSIATLAGQTITPSASQQTVSSSGKYMTGNVVVNAVSNLTAGNIKKGIVVGGVTGTFEGYVPTATDLYLRGNNIAGGWTKGGSGTGTYYYVNLETGQISVGIMSNNGYLTTSSTINLTGYNGIAVEGHHNGSSQNNLYIRLATANGSYADDNGGGASSTTAVAPTSNFTAYCDVSAINAARYIHINIVNVSFYVYRIWLY